MKYISYSLNHKHAKAPSKKYTGDAGWDLFVSRPTVIPVGGTVDVHTDIAIDMPPFVFGRITGRSSTLKRHKLLVNEGIIDNGYTGELFIVVHNVGTEDFVVDRGMRLAQVIFQRIEDVRWAEVEEVVANTNDRGDNGFGSTGEFEIEEE